MKKVFDKCKLIHALKQPKNLLRLFSKPKVQNCIYKKYGLYRYNLCTSYAQEYSSFITSNGLDWKIRCHINCKSINVLYFLLCNSCNGNTTCTAKTVNFRDRINNHITTCCYGTSTDKFDNHFFKCSNKNHHVVKEPYFENNHIDLHLHSHQQNKETNKKNIHSGWRWNLISSAGEPQQKWLYWNSRNSCSGHQLMSQTTSVTIFTWSPFLQLQNAILIF